MCHFCRLRRKRNRHSLPLLARTPVQYPETLTTNGSTTSGSWQQQHAVDAPIILDRFFTSNPSVLRPISLSQPSDTAPSFWSPWNGRTATFSPMPLDRKIALSVWGASAQPGLRHMFFAPRSVHRHSLPPELPAITPENRRKTIAPPPPRSPPPSFDTVRELTGTVPWHRRPPSGR